MRRKFNYTGRQRISRSQTAFNIRDGATGGRSFDARLTLEGLSLPPEAKVYVEAFYKRTSMRFDFGTVGALTQPADRTLTDLERGDVVFFNVKIVDESGEHGLLLASGEGISASNSDSETLGKQPILPVNHTDELGDLVWRLRIEESSGPVLEVNSRIDGIREAVRSDRTFFALVFPAVLREVLTHIVVREELHPDDAADDTWYGEWMAFVRTFHFGDPPPEGSPQDELDAWIDDVASSFASRHSIREAYAAALEVEY